MSLYGVYTVLYFNFQFIVFWCKLNTIFCRLLSCIEIFLHLFRRELNISYSCCWILKITNVKCNYVIVKISIVILFKQIPMKLTKYSVVWQTACQFNSTILYYRFGESYTWSNINCCVHNVIVGKIWIEHVSMHINSNYLVRREILKKFNYANFCMLNLI